MEYPFLSRTQLIYGEAIVLLSERCVAVFGLGGVGGYCIEALARSGVGSLVLIDNDIVSESNINRQILASYSSIGHKKTEVAKLRLKDINPQIEIVCHNIFFDESTKDLIDFCKLDYIVDAIDSMSSKVLLAVCAKQFSVPIISCMGTANKYNPSMLAVTDIFKTTEDPIARIMRNSLRKANIDALKVVYSLEKPINISLSDNVLKEKIDNPHRKILGSNAFVPATAGLLLAKEAVSDLLRKGEII